MALDGALCQVELPRDLAVREPQHDHTEDLLLPDGQRRRSHDLARLGRHDDLPSARGAHGGRKCAVDTRGGDDRADPASQEATNDFAIGRS